MKHIICGVTELHLYTGKSVAYSWHIVKIKRGIAVTDEVLFEIPITNIVKSRTLTRAGFWELLHFSPVHDELC